MEKQCGFVKSGSISDAFVRLRRDVEEMSNVCFTVMFEGGLSDSGSYRRLVGREWPSSFLGSLHSRILFLVPI